MEDIYEDLETISGIEGLFTHMLPNAAKAITPWLNEHVKDPRFWDDKYDITHTGDYPLPVTTEDDKIVIQIAFGEMPSLLNHLGSNVEA